jgi:hypothetical protein
MIRPQNPPMSLAPRSTVVKKKSPTHETVSSILEFPPEP